MTRRSPYGAIAGTLALAAVVGVAVALLLVRPWENDGTSAGGSVSVSRGRECLPADLVPPLDTPLPPDDCVTGTALVPNGDAVIGTNRTALGIVRNGVIEEIAAVPNASGPVSDIHVPLDQELVNADQDPVVTFVVNEGLGIYSLQRNEFIRLPADEPFVVEGYYLSPPGPDRPRYSPDLSYFKETDDGVLQRFGFDAAPHGALCAVYMPHPAGKPSHIWCTGSGYLFTRPVSTLAPRPATATPPPAPLR